MLRWVFLIAAIAAFAVAFQTDSPSTLGWALLVGFVAFIAAGLGFAAARVQAVSRGQASREMALLATSVPKVRQKVEERAGAGPATVAGTYDTPKGRADDRRDADGTDGDGSGVGGGGD